jgi:hypothetical protein
VKTLVESTYTLGDLLAQKAAIFQERADSFTSPFGLLGDSGDSQIWTGIYIASQIYRYKATGEPEALARAERALWGFHALTEITGQPGLFARNIKATPVDRYNHEGTGKYAGWYWKGNLSFDQYLGLLYGITEAWPYIQDEKLKRTLRADIHALGRHFIENDAKIIFGDTYLDSSPRNYNQDQWPKFLKPLRFLSDFLPDRGGNAMQGLHIMKSVAYITGDPIFEKYYREELVERRGYAESAEKSGLGRDERVFKAMAPVASLIYKATHGWKEGFDVKVTVESLRSPVAHNLTHVALSNLARLETDPEIRRHYVNGLVDAHAPVSKQGNTYWNLLTAAHAPDPAGVADAVATLAVFPTDDRIKRENSLDPSIAKYKAYKIPRPKEGPAWRWMAKDPLPFEKRPLHAFHWQHNANDLDGGDWDDSPGSAYLVGYWLGRLQGVVPAPSSGKP